MAIFVWILAAVCAVTGVARLASLARNPDVYLLIPDGQARWVRLNQPYNLLARQPVDIVYGFRRVFTVEQVPSTAILKVTSFRDCLVELDGQSILSPRDDLNEWKHARQVDLAPYLKPGNHELRIAVRNVDSHPALLARCDELDIQTDESWEAADSTQQWRPVMLADTPQRTDISRQYPRSDRGLLSILPVLVPVFLLIGFLSAIRQFRPNNSWAERLTPSPAMFRWIIMAAWVALAVNNIGKLSHRVGFDVDFHIQYIQFIVDHSALPLATDGWQTFQSPLNYLLSAPLYLLFDWMFEIEGIIKALRVIPLACGIAQVEICYRVMRLVFPDRHDLQRIGTAIGGLLPVNLYMCQYLGNEPLTSLTTGITICLALSYAYGAERSRSNKGVMILGGALGLALLSKVTPVLIVAPVLVWISAWGWVRELQWKRILIHVGIVLITAAIISGWYYGRNWIELGKPFVGGWDPMIGVKWWQDPSYRTPADFTRFGDALTYPVTAPVGGFWDATYSTLWTDGHQSSMVKFEGRPTWNESFLVALALLGLVPMILMLIGGARGLYRTDQLKRGAIVLSVFLAAIYWGAVLDLYLRLPIYSTVKASYTSGLIPCYAILITAGASCLGRHWLIRAIIAGLIACFAITSYITFFIW